MLWCTICSVLFRPPEATSLQVFEKFKSNINFQLTSLNVWFAHIGWWFVCFFFYSTCVHLEWHFCVYSYLNKIMYLTSETHFQVMAFAKVQICFLKCKHCFSHWLNWSGTGKAYSTCAHSAVNIWAQLPSTVKHRVVGDAGNCGRSWTVVLVSALQLPPHLYLLKKCKNPCQQSVPVEPGSQRRKNKFSTQADDLETYLLWKQIKQL